MIDENGPVRETANQTPIVTKRIEPHAMRSEKFGYQKESGGGEIGRRVSKMD
jgi:hypothetical protein